jgi:MoaA/NifB/PqqE/SkfB family radical SAM enzyme
MQQIPVITPDPPISSYQMLLQPTSVHVRLSAKCDSDCVYCERESWKSGHKAVEHDMSEDVWERVLEKFVPHAAGVEVVGLGEPMLSKLFPRVCRDVIDAGKILYFATNGHFLDRPHVLAAVGDAPRVSVSIDAATPETYIKIGRGKAGDFERTIRAVKAFRRAKPSAFLHSQFTAGIYNIDELPQFIELAADLGIQEVLMRMVHDHAIAREDVSLRFHRQRTEAAIDAARAIARERGIWFTAERRPYAETQVMPMSVDDPTSRLRRYLDFVPMSAVVCPGDTCTTWVSSTSTAANATCYFHSSATSSAGVTQLTSSYNYFTVCVNAVTQSSAGVPTAIAVALTTCTTLYSLSASNSLTHMSGLYQVVDWCYLNFNTSILAFAGDLTTTISTAQTAEMYATSIPGIGIVTEVSFNTSSLSTVVSGGSFGANGCTTTNYIQPLSIGNIVVLGPADRVLASPRQSGDRSRLVVEPTGTVAPADQTVLPTEAALIVAADGDCWSCFAQHVVGNVRTDTWDDIVRRPRYQAFLQRRANLNSTVWQEPWCMGCARVV